MKVLHEQDGYSIAFLCRTFGWSRSCWYARSTDDDDSALRSAIEQVVSEFPTYGSRRVAAQLRRPPHSMTVNRKRVQRLMRSMGLQRPVKRRSKWTTNSQHGYPRYPNLVQDLTVTSPDQVWVSDITYIRLQVGFVYLCVIMDVFTRSIRGWELSRSLDHQFTLTALQRALTERRPMIHHSDQGVQYAATEYTDLLNRNGVQISMSDSGEPQQNAFAERVIRTIKEEEVDLSDYGDFTEAYEQIGAFIEQVYQHKRIHSALGYLTPAEFERAWERRTEPWLAVDGVGGGHSPQPLGSARDRRR